MPKLENFLGCEIQKFEMTWLTKHFLEKYFARILLLFIIKCS